MKILVTPTSFLQPENRATREKLERFADTVVYNDLGRPLQPDEILDRIDGVDGYIAGLDYITQEAIRAMPETVKVISRYGAGVDRVDRDAARERDIVLTNTPNVNSIAVAELAFALMLAAARAIPQMDAEVRAGNWPRRQGTELANKRLGIIGYGAIGRALATRAQAFGMQVVAYDPFMDRLFDAVEGGSDPKDLDRLIRTCQFISLHVPLDASTYHLIDQAAIDRMLPGVILVNTARGGIVDEAAALHGLRDGKIGTLCLDAYEQEPPTASPLRNEPRVIFYPHGGAHTKEAVAKMGMTAVDNLIAVLTNTENPLLETPGCPFRVA